MSVSVSPVDGAFPQLVRWHDPAHVVDVLGAAGLGEVAADDVTVETVRYRPRQRHVLRIGTGADGRGCFAKVYRDEAGGRAVDAAARAATAFAAAGDCDLAAAPVVGTYVAAERVTLWPEVSGRSLTEAVSLDGAAAAGAVRTAGTTLRLLHDAPVGEGLSDCPDAVAHTDETLRTAEILDELVPTVGARLRREVGRGLELLTALPLEPPTTVHGDFKCDNLLVAGSRLHVLDFDRLGRGDPAADIGKFLADLRWAVCGDGHALGGLRAVFLEGYGDMSSARAARAHVYDGLLQLRMAARRVPIQDGDWADRVTRAVDVAADTLAEER
jgi:aminoglycoside phosphotransferase (APT) family kinase protein